MNSYSIFVIDRIQGRHTGMWFLLRTKKGAWTLYYLNQSINSLEKSVSKSKLKCITNFYNCLFPLYILILHPYPTGQLSILLILTLTCFLHLTNIHSPNSGPFRIWAHIMVQHSINSEVNCRTFNFVSQSTINIVGLVCNSKQKIK